MGIITTIQNKECKIKKKQTNVGEIFPANPIEELEVYLLSEDTETKERVFGVYLNDDIIEPSYYNQVFLTLATATKNDVINFFFNTGGGQADTAIELISYIKTTQAFCVANIVGSCHSAGSLIALACDDFRVYPYASMLIHTYSGGLYGKRSDVEAQVKHEYQHFKNFFTDIYKGFLTATELKRVWDGKDVWLDANNIVTRLNKMKPKIEEDVDGGN